MKNLKGLKLWQNKETNEFVIGVNLPEAIKTNIPEVDITVSNKKYKEIHYLEPKDRIVLNSDLSLSPNKEISKKVANRTYKEKVIYMNDLFIIIDK